MLITSVFGNIVINYSIGKHFIVLWKILHIHFKTYYKSYGITSVRKVVVDHQKNYY